MPIYEFRCARCGKIAEVVQRVGDRPPPCPKCGSKRMARAVSRTSFHLKGGGWHADLYATPRPGKAEGATAAKAPEEKPAAAKASDPAAPTTPPTPTADAKATEPGESTRPARRRPGPTKKRR